MSYCVLCFFLLFDLGMPEKELAVCSDAQVGRCERDNSSFIKEQIPGAKESCLSEIVIIRGLNLMPYLLREMEGLSEIPRANSPEKRKKEEEKGGRPMKPPHFVPDPS